MIMIFQYRLPTVVLKIITNKAPRSFVRRSLSLSFRPNCIKIPSSTSVETSLIKKMNLTSLFQGSSPKPNVLVYAIVLQELQNAMVVNGIYLFLYKRSHTLHGVIPLSTLNLC